MDKLRRQNGKTRRNDKMERSDEKQDEKITRWKGEMEMQDVKTK